MLQLNTQKNPATPEFPGEQAPCPWDACTSGMPIQPPTLLGINSLRASFPLLAAGL